jgi:hypothetical protein
VRLTREGWKALIVILAGLVAMVLGSFVIGWVTGGEGSLFLGVMFGIAIALGGMAVYYEWTDQ